MVDCPEWIQAVGQGLVTYNAFADRWLITSSKGTAIITMIISYCPFCGQELHGWNH